MKAAKRATSGRARDAGAQRGAYKLIFLSLVTQRKSDKSDAYLGNTYAFKSCTLDIRKCLTQGHRAPRRADILEVGNCRPGPAAEDQLIDACQPGRGGGGHVAAR